MKMYFSFFGNHFNKVAAIGCVMVFLLTTIGCATSSKKKPAVKPIQDTHEKKPVSTFYEPLPPSEGSLWTDSGDLFFVDKRAKRIGDTIIVDIVENTSSQMDVNTKAERTSTLNAGMPNWFGRMTQHQGTHSYFNPSTLIGTSYGNSTEGKGSSDRSGQITASIGASVTEVLPNSNLVLYGRREMKVNNESQYITVSGVVRPEDVGSDNRVKSTYLADARIAYSGRGVLADKQKTGWLTRALDTVWPF